MKMLKNIMMVFLLCTSLAFAQKQIPAVMRIVIVDDRGYKLGGVPIRGSFPYLWDGSKGNRFNGITDEEGVYVAEGMAMNELFVMIEKEEYYPTIWRHYNKKYPNMSKWEETIEIKLKKIRNPIPMYVRKFYNPHIEAVEGWGKERKYNLGRTSEYDFVKADFLPPYGKGEVGDIKYVWKMEIYKKDQYGIADDCDTYCEIVFTNCVDGVCRGKPDGGLSGSDGSGFISDYEAPLEGYTNKVVFWYKFKGSEYRRETNDDEHKLYYFRIRTQVDKDGVITNAIYGKIYGELNRPMTYYLNPTPNDRNMEYDGKTNLFPDQQKEKYMP